MKTRMLSIYLLKIFIALFLISAVVFLNGDKKVLFVKGTWGAYSHIPKHYLDVAKNAPEMGPLVSGTEGHYKIYSIEDHDPAFPILISVLSFFGVKFHGPLDFQRINHVLLWFSLLCFSLVFLKKSLPVFSVVQVLILFYFYQVGFGQSSEYIDSHSAVPALVILTFFLVEIFFKDKMNGFYGKLFVLAVTGSLFAMFRNYFSHLFILLVIACFFKQTSNFIGVFRCFRREKPRKFKTQSVLCRRKKGKTSFILCFIASVIAIGVVLNLGNLVQKGFYSYARKKNPDLNLSSPFQLPPPYRHNIWHNAYISLGFFPNKWGIEVADVVGYRHANSHDPTVFYPHPEYYNALRKLYFKYLKGEPFEHIKNHIKKSLKVVAVFTKKNSFLIEVFLLIFYYNFYFRERQKTFKALSINSCHIIPFLLFFIVPVITIPRFSYAVVTYLSLVIIKLISRQLEILLKKNS